MFDRVSRPQNSSLIETLALADNQLDEVAGGFTPQQLAQMQDTSNKTQTTAQKAAEQADAFIRS